MVTPHRPDRSTPGSKTSGLLPVRAFPYVSEGTWRLRRGSAYSFFLLALLGRAGGIPTPRWCFRSKAVPPT